jgi:hypothetical protein
MLGLGSSLVTSGKVESWVLDDEPSLEAYWKYATGTQTDGGSAVAGYSIDVWDDQTSNGYDMIQDTTGEEPVYFPLTHAGLEFTPGNASTLALASGHITLGGNFIIGLKIKPDISGVTVFGSNSITNEIFKLFNDTTIRFKNDSASADFVLGSESTTDSSYYVMSRDSSNVVTIYKDGTGADFTDNTQTITGTFDINCMGRKAGTANYYDGLILEMVIFKGNTDAAAGDIIDGLHNRLATIPTP